MKKIEKTREDVLRLQTIKKSKIGELAHKIRAARQTQDELEKRQFQAKE